MFLLGFKFIPKHHRQWVLTFIRINQLGWLLNDGKGFSKMSKPSEQDGAHHLQFPVTVFSWWETGNREIQQMVANGEEISAVPFRTEKEDYLCR